MNTSTKTPTKTPSRRMARTPTHGGGDTGQEGAKKPSPEVVQPIAKPGATPKRSTKTDLILALLRRNEGATLDQMVNATGWLPHTTRAALTGLRKKGHVVTSEKPDGVRIYRVAVSNNI